MMNCQNLWLSLFFGVLLKTQQSVAKPLNESIEVQSAHLELITEDVIHDEIERDIKNIIRVNPLDLPPLKDDTNASNMDSSLYKIKTLKPYKNQRNYLNLQRSKPRTDVTTNSQYPAASSSRAFSLLSRADKTSKAKHQQKAKHLHFLYNQADLAGNFLTKSLPIHVAAGAYPVYYVVAKTNGRFGKYPLKSFGSAKDFMKYLQIKKIEHTPALPATEQEI